MVQEVRLETASEKQAAILRTLPPGGLSPFLAHAPVLAEAVMNLGLVLFDEAETGIPDQLREAIAIRAGRSAGSSYVASQHLKLGAAFGIAPDVLRVLDHGSGADELPADWQPAIRLFEEALQGGTVRKDDVGRIVATFGEKGLVSIAATAGLYLFMGMLARWAGLDAPLASSSE